MIINMAKVDPLQMAAAEYATEKWDLDDWHQLGRTTGTTDILSGHPRLYRSLTFGDDDYADAALSVLRTVLAEGIEEGSGEAGRMELVADAMEDLPQWVKENATPRARRLFSEYLESRDVSEIPPLWVGQLSLSGDETTQTESSSTSEDSWLPDPSAATPATSAPKRPESSPGVGSGSGDVSVRESQKAELIDRDQPIFIVHGHDDSALNSIRVFVHRVTGKMPISLAEEAGRGQTIIEKFEDIGGGASFVIVLLTPDDVGQTAGSHSAGDPPTPRARQNVVLELGYFMGKIGRENVLVVDAEVEHPSDIKGLSYVPYPGTNWKEDIRTELAAAGLLK